MPSILEVLRRVGTIGSGAARGDCDVVLRPEVAGMGLFDWHARERAIAAGFRMTCEQLPENAVTLGSQVERHGTETLKAVE